MDASEYKKFSDEKAPRSPILKNCVKAFLSGGVICTLGETLSAGKLVSFGFIWAGVLLYVLNSVYEEKMAKKAITRS